MTEIPLGRQRYFVMTSRVHAPARAQGDLRGCTPRSRVGKVARKPFARRAQSPRRSAVKRTPGRLEPRGSDSMKHRGIGSR
jgi:hypothetical protein